MANEANPIKTLTINGVTYKLKGSVESLQCGEIVITADNSGNADVSSLFSRVDTSAVTVDGLLSNVELEKSVKVCAKKYGGTQIKQDGEGNFYYEVEEE